MRWTAALVLAATVAAGCRREAAPAPRTTITFWHTFTADETEVVNARIAAFEAAHPDVKVQASAIPFGSAQSRIKEAFAVGETPDLFRIEAGWTPEYVRLGVLVPAQEWLPEEDRADLLPQAAALFTVDGKLAAAPHVVDCLALLYNKTLLDAAHVAVPADYDALAAASHTLTDSRAGRYGFFLRGDGYWYLPFLWGFGGDLVDAKGNVALDSPQAIAAMKAYVDLERKGTTPPGTDWPADYRRMMRMFADGQVAMILNGPWATSELLQGAAFKGHEDALGIAPVPSGPHGSAPATPIGAHGYGIASTSKHRAEAAELARWLVSTDSEAAFAAHANVLPARRAAWSRPEVTGNRIVSQFRAVLDTGRGRPTDAELSYIFGTLSSAVQEVAEGQLDETAAMKAVAKQWRERRAVPTPTPVGSKAPAVPVHAETTPP
ncbi:MAG TPA: extracellular solute-binding protein [bacterium]|nr:extracellular solute-binding protein [bacterium]